MLVNDDSFHRNSDETVSGLLVGTNWVLHSIGEEQGNGCWVSYFYPAFHNGERAWLEKRIWSPSGNYCYENESEYILPFEDGVKMLINNGKFSFSQSEELFTEKTELRADLCGVQRFIRGIKCLLVGEHPCLIFESGGDSEYFVITIYPAWSMGKRAWVAHIVDQNESIGTSEKIFEFEDGVKMIIENGVFRFTA